jgi:putative Mg2+ transporter-C (MgtC) family protein
LEQIYLEIVETGWLPLPVIVARLSLAVLLGGLVGFEREAKNRPAGLRTHILVCLAAATASILTIEITHMDEFSDEAIRIDPIRLVEALTAGVAFLAAGMIVFARGRVHGLTTGAGMWLAGMIGLAVGIGHWQIAVLTTVLALIVLWLLRHFEEAVNGTNGAKFAKAPETDKS